MFRKLLLRVLSGLTSTGTNRRQPISAIHKTPSLCQLSADDIYDAVTQAEGGDTGRLMALYEQIIADNSHLQTEFGKRKLAVLGDDINVQAAGEDPADDAAAAFIQDWIRDSPDFMDACIALLDSTIYPVAVVQKWFEPGGRDRRYTLRFERVDPELFDFRLGDFKIFDTCGGARAGSSHCITDDRYIVHRAHLLTLPDCWGGPMRSILGWHLLSHTTPEWWGRFLERLGAPFLVGHVGSGDDGEREKVEQAFSQALRLFGLVVSEGTRIEMLQAQSSQTGEAHAMLHDKCCREISKLIAGQTSGSDANATGSFNSSAAEHTKVRYEYRDWDEKRLCRTLITCVFTPLLRVNGFSGRCPLVRFGTADVDSLELNGQILYAIMAAGLELTDEAVENFGSRIGLTLRRATAPAEEDSQGPPARPGAQRPPKLPSGNPPRPKAPQKRPALSTSRLKAPKTEGDKETELSAPFSAERGMTIRRADLIQGAQTRLLGAAVPRMTRAITAVELPDEILGTGAEVLLEYLETAGLQGQ